MDVLGELKEKLNMDIYEYKEAKDVIRNMEETINSKGIYFDEQIKIGFYSHMVSFLRRLKKNDLVTDVDEQIVLDQIEKENLELAIDLTRPLFQKYDVNYSHSEVVLIAIYIQTGNKNE